MCGAVGESVPTIAKDAECIAIVRRSAHLNAQHLKMTICRSSFGCNPTVVCSPRKRDTEREADTHRDTGSCTRKGTAQERCCALFKRDAAHRASSSFLWHLLFVAKCADIALFDFTKVRIVGHRLCFIPETHLRRQIQHRDERFRCWPPAGRGSNTRGQRCAASNIAEGTDKACAVDPSTTLSGRPIRWHRRRSKRRWRASGSSKSSGGGSSSTPASCTPLCSFEGDCEWCGC